MPVRFKLLVFTFILVAFFLGLVLGGTARKPMVVFADEDPCPQPFSSLTVTGNVSIGSEPSPVEQVNIHGSSFDVSADSAENYYTTGFLGTYGPDGNGLFYAAPSINENDTTGYCMGLTSTGLVVGVGGTGAFLAGGDGVVTGGEDVGAQVSLTGGLLAALTSDNGFIQSAVHLKGDGDNGCAYMGAVHDDGSSLTESSVKIDTSGQIIVQLGAPLVTETLQTGQQSNTNSRLQQRSSSGGTTTEGQSGRRSDSVLGTRFPRAELVHAANR